MADNSAFTITGTTPPPVAAPSSNPTPQAPTVSSQSTIPQSVASTPSNGIDYGALTLARSIAMQESSGGRGMPNYTATGDNGTSYGAYQWNNGKSPIQPGQLPVNFTAEAKQYGLDPMDFSPENQDKVAYSRVMELKKQGLSPDQIAASWNAGMGHINDWQTMKGTTIINGKPISYDVPAYVNNVKNYYQQLAQQNPPQTLQNAPTATGGGEISTDPGFGANVMSGNYLGAAKNVFNGALPIVSDLANDFNGSSIKTKLQQLGDLGMSALWFLPFGEIAEGAGLGARVLMGAGKGVEGAAALTAEALPTAGNIANAAKITKTANLGKTIGNVATGLGAGYVGDVSNNLSQGQTGADVLKPGLGTAIGGIAPVALSGAASVFNKFHGQQEIVNKVQQAYEDAAGSTKSGISGMSKTAAKGLDSNPEFLANAGILPETEEINGRRVFTTGEDSVSQQTLQKRVNDLTALRDEAISKAGESHPAFMEDMRNQALQKAETEFDGSDRQLAINHINKEFDAYKSQYGDGQGNISLREQNKIKMSLQGKTNFDATQSRTINRTNKMMSAIAKEGVEKGAETAGLKNVGELNKIIQQHLDAIKFLQKINGQTIKGGRIGKYLAEGVGALAGNAAGGVFGGGIGGAIGTVAGAGAGALFSRFLQKFTSGGTISAAAVGRMAQEEPEVVQQFLDYIDKNGEKVAPMLKPTKITGASVTQDILHKSPGDKIRDIFDHEGASKHYSPQEIEDFLKSRNELHEDPNP